MLAQTVSSQNPENHFLTSVQVLSAKYKLMRTIHEMTKAQVRERFERAGGRVYEFAAAEGVKVHPNGVSLVLPESTSRESSAGNGAAASASGLPGRNALW